MKIRKTKRYGVRGLFTDGRRHFDTEKRTDSWHPAIFDTAEKAVSHAIEYGFGERAVYAEDVEVIDV